MGLWVSKLLRGARLPPLEEELVPASQEHLRPGEEQQSGLQLEMIQHSAAMFGSPSAPQRNEEPSNDSRHLPSENENQGKVLKSAKVFAYWSGSISFTGLMGIIGARVGNFAANVKKLPLYACSTFICCAFIISVLLLIFTALKNSTTIIRAIQFLILVSFSLAMGFGLAMVF